MSNHSKKRTLICGLAVLAVGLGQALLGVASGPLPPQKPDVEVVSNPKTPVPPAGKRTRLVFKEELSIGVKEGDEKYMFGSDIVFNTDDEGNFYVTDWDKKAILKYDPSGKYVRTIGRQGQGPGEFQNLSVVRFDRDGALYVTDLSAQRISFFDKDGTYLRQIPIPDVFEDLYVAAKGGYVSSRTIPAENEGGMGFKIVDGFFNDKFELATELNVRLSFYKPPSGRDAASRAKFTAGILSDMAFRPSPMHLVAADGLIYFGYPEDYAVDVFSAEGKKIKTIKRAYDPIKVSDKDKGFFEATRAKPFATRTGGRSEAEVREILKFIEYPDHKPAYQYFSLMENGWLVVLVDIAAGDHSLFDLFDERGRYIGQFKAGIFPDYGRFFFFKNGKAYAVEADEEGFKSAKRFGYMVENY
jgi:6-bladed beta-propeller